MTRSLRGPSIDYLPKIVFLGSFNMKRNERAGRLAVVGADHHLSKPIEKAEIVKMLDALGYDYSAATRP